MSHPFASEFTPGPDEPAAWVENLDSNRAEMQTRGYSEDEIVAELARLLRGYRAGAAASSRHPHRRGRGLPRARAERCERGGGCQRPRHRRGHARCLLRRRSARRDGARGHSRPGADPRGRRRDDLRRRRCRQDDARASISPSTSPPVTTGSASRSPRPVRVLLDRERGAAPALPRKLARKRDAWTGARRSTIALRVIEDPWGRLTFATTRTATRWRP